MKFCYAVFKGENHYVCGEFHHLVKVYLNKRSADRFCKGKKNYKVRKVEFVGQLQPTILNPYGFN